MDQVARINSEKHNAKVQFLRMDILTEVIDEMYDVIVSNPPYLTRSEMNELSEFVLSSLASYNFDKVIVTSDHGFLFNDLTIQENDKQAITEEATERLSQINEKTD